MRCGRLVEVNVGFASKKRRRVQLICKDESLTKQSFKDQCDVNKILAKYRKTGLIDHVRNAEGRYDDFSTVVDYQTALNEVIEAQNMFMALPSVVRKRFGNDPGMFLEFCNDPANIDEMVKLGLAVRRPVDKPVEAPADGEKPK